jgi:hypothetical protein
VGSVTFSSSTAPVQDEGGETVVQVNVHGGPIGGVTCVLVAVLAGTERSS